MWKNIQTFIINIRYVLMNCTKQELKEFMLKEIEIIQDIIKLIKIKIIE